MVLEYKVEPKNGYLLMTCTGTYEPSAAGEFTDQIVEACKIHRPAKFLIDLRQVEGDMTTMNRFELSVLAAAKYFANILTGQISKCRYAIVGNHPLVDPHKFEETVATNRGINVRTFTELKNACNWLEVEQGEK
jgi:hypothetical protein